MLIIDRFEENFAVVEDSESEKMIKIEKNMIDVGAREGDVIFSDGRCYKPDKEATEARREDMRKLLKSIDIKRKGREGNGE